MGNYHENTYTFSIICLRIMDGAKWSQQILTNENSEINRVITAAAHVILSEAKNLSRKTPSSQGFFASLIMTNVTRLFSEAS